MESSSPQFQTIDVLYPKTLFASWCWLKTRERFLPYMIECTFENFDDLYEYTVSQIDLVQRRRGADEVLNTIGIALLSQTSFLPLKKEYWHAIDSDTEVEDRIFNFLPALDTPEKYQIAVTPTFQIDSPLIVEYRIGFAFKTGHFGEAESLMKSSNLFVTPEAKKAAIYDIKDLYGYDLITKERVTKDFKN